MPPVAELVVGGAGLGTARCLGGAGVGEVSADVSAAAGAMVSRCGSGYRDAVHGRSSTRGGAKGPTRGLGVAVCGAGAGCWPTLWRTIVIGGPGDGGVPPAGGAVAAPLAAVASWELPLPSGGGVPLSWWLSMLRHRSRGLSSSQASGVPPISVAMAWVSGRGRMGPSGGGGAGASSSLSKLPPSPRGSASSSNRGSTARSASSHRSLRSSGRAGGWACGPPPRCGFWSIFSSWAEVKPA